LYAVHCELTVADMLCVRVVDVITTVEWQFSLEFDFSC